MSAKVGDLIRIERQKKQYTQYYMANRLNISQNYYSKIERGESDLTITKLYEVSRILNISVHDILPETNEGISINISFLSKIWIWIKVGFKRILSFY